MEILPGPGDITVVAMIGEQQHGAAEIIGGKPALRRCIDLIMLFQHEGAEGGEIHRGGRRIGIFRHQQAVDDPIDAVIVGLLDQHVFSLERPVEARH